MSESVYDDLIMDHIRNARNYCVVPDADRAETGSNPLCGDEMTVYVKLDGERIEDLGFQCTCCGISMASASMMTQMVKGKRVGEAREVLRSIVSMIEHADGAEGENSPERLAMIDTVRRFPARAGCAALPWKTLESGLEAISATREQ
jgi:nitrogen fixation NifU-like protein